MTSLPRDVEIERLMSRNNINIYKNPTALSGFFFSFGCAVINSTLGRELARQGPSAYGGIFLSCSLQAGLGEKFKNRPGKQKSRMQVYLHAQRLYKSLLFILQFSFVYVVAKSCKQTF